MSVRPPIAHHRGRLLVLLALVASLVATAQGAGAQRVDSARVTPRAAKVDTSSRPVAHSPLSPRRAFLYSLALPGYGQSILNRPTAATIFVLAEAIGIAMLRQSNADLQEARRMRTDSLVTIGYDANTQAPIQVPSPWTDGLINVRRGHREDWVAALIANHFFAGADAFVAAHLWDLPSQVAIRQTENGTAIAARVTW